jgi:hypothetical protein
MHLQNGILRDHTAQYPRRLSSSTKTTPKLLEISEKREGKNLSFWLLNLHVYKVGNWKITVMVGHVHATALWSIVQFALSAILLLTVTTAHPATADCTSCSSYSCLVLVMQYLLLAAQSVYLMFIW